MNSRKHMIQYHLVTKLLGSLNALGPIQSNFLFTLYSIFFVKLESLKKYKQNFTCVVIDKFNRKKQIIVFTSYYKFVDWTTILEKEFPPSKLTTHCQDICVSACSVTVLFGTVKVKLNFLFFLSLTVSNFNSLSFVSLEKLFYQH